MNTNQQNELLMHMSLYADFEDFEERSFMDREELEEKLEEGFIQELTRGTYNGALDIFTPNTLTPVELAGALYQYLHETDYVNTLYTQHEDSDDLETFEQLTMFDVLEDFLNCYDVFTIGNEVYADIS